MPVMLPISLTLFALAYLFAALFVLGRKKPGYSHLRHTISELGESGAPQETLVAMGVFLPIGLVLLLVAYLVRHLAVEEFALALCLALGYIVAAVFPCDAGSPTSGSWRQAIHNAGGAVEYLGGAFALVRMAEYLGPLFKVLGMVVLGSAILISLPPLAAVRGLVQRVAELCLFGGLALSVKLHWVMITS